MFKTFLQKFLVPKIILVQICVTRHPLVLSVLAETDII